MLTKSENMFLRAIIFLILSIGCEVPVFAENKTAQVLLKYDLPALEAHNAKLITDQNNLIAVTSVGENDKRYSNRIEVWMSSDEGSTWMHKGQLPIKKENFKSDCFSAGMGLDSELIVICPVKGDDKKSRVLAVYVSQDYGKTWNLRGQLPAELALQGYAPVGSVTIADGGYTSEDGISGELEEGAGKARLCCFLQAPVDISNFEQTGPSVMCWSGDRGKSWEAASTVEDNSRGISAVFTKGGPWNNNWFAAVETSFSTRGTDLYESYNGGLHWRNELTITNKSAGTGNLIYLPSKRLAFVYMENNPAGCSLRTRYTDRMTPGRHMGGMAWRHDITVESFENAKPVFSSSVVMPTGIIITLTGRIDSAGKTIVSAIKWKLPEPEKGEPVIKAELSSSVIREGEPVIVTTSCENADIEPVLVLQNFVDPVEVLPGFQYDPVREIAWMDSNLSNGKINLSTEGWYPGVHFFSVLDRKKYSASVVDLAITVREANPRFNVEEIRSYSSKIIPLLKLPEGVVLASGYSSKDGGLTWENDRAEARGYGCLLQSGEILILSGCKKSEQEGHYTMNGFISNDKLKTANPIQGDLFLPQFVPGFAHGHYEAPLVHRTVLELPDNTLIATLYGRFKGDNDPQIWEGDQRAMRMRSFLVASEDKGKTWTYRSTIADPADVVTMEGFDETSMVLLPNGELLCVVRSGDNAHAGWNQNNLYLVRSPDGGRTWGKPVKLREEGASPHLYVMSNGTLVCSFERPGSSLMFSDDNGHTWGSHINLHAGRYRGYGTICELSSNTLLFTHQGQHSVIKITRNSLR